MKEVRLPSGATLKIDLPPFADSKALYQAFLKEAKTINIDAKSDVVAIVKELVCIGFASPEVERCLWECFKRCLYNSGKGDFRITPDTFEPVEARGDYLMVCTEVAKENIFPFVKSLYAQYAHVIATILQNPA